MYLKLMLSLMSMPMSASYSYRPHASPSLMACMLDGSRNTSGVQARSFAQDGWTIDPSVGLYACVIYRIVLFVARLYITMAVCQVAVQAAQISNIEISNLQTDKAVGFSFINITQWFLSLKSNPQTLSSLLHFLQVSLQSSLVPPMASVRRR